MDASIRLPRNTVRFACASAAILLLLATIVSHLEQRGLLPPELVGGKLRLLTTSKTVLGIPLELPLALWFVLLAIAPSDGRFEGSLRYRFWAGVVVAGLCVGIAAKAGLSCVPITFGAATASLVVLSSARRLFGTSAQPKSAADIVRADLVILTRKPQIVRVSIWALSALIVGQYMYFSSRNVTAAQLDEEIVRWFETEPQIRTNDFVAVGKLRVVTFSDYLCPACSFTIPELETIVERYNRAGRNDIELIRHDFPLSPACNAAVPFDVHPTACPAAAAVRLTEDVLGQERAQELRRALYRRHGALTREQLDRAVADLGLSTRFKSSYDGILMAIKKDAEVGERLGINSTPTIFIDGRRVRGANQAKVIQAVISSYVRKTIGVPSTGAVGGVSP